MYIKSDRRLEGKPFSLAGRGRSPVAGVSCAPPTLATATTLGVNNTRGTVAPLQP
jgi:hypothetical protein